MSARQPLTRQRSPWAEDAGFATYLRARGLAEPDARVFRRNVHDGQLVAFVGTIPGQGLHLSISHRDHRDKPGRYPTWDEIAHAREQLLPDDRGFHMILPPSDEYVAVHDTTFHLHELPAAGVTELAGVWWRCLFGTDDDGMLVRDDEGRLVCRLEPAVDDPDTTDTYMATLREEPVDTTTEEE